MEQVVTVNKAKTFEKKSRKNSKCIVQIGSGSIICGIEYVTARKLDLITLEIQNDPLTQRKLF